MFLAVDQTRCRVISILRAVEINEQKLFKIKTAPNIISGSLNGKEITVGERTHRWKGKRCWEENGQQNVYQ